MPSDRLYSSSEAYDLVLAAKDYIVKLAVIADSNQVFKNSNRAKHDLLLINLLIDIVNGGSLGTAKYRFIDDSSDGFNKVVSFLKHKIESGNIVTYSPLAIVTQPTGLTLAIGGTISLSTSATGGVGSYRYQWFYTNASLDIYNKVISGATSSSYTKPSAGIADSGDYYCKVTDSNGSSVSTNTVSISVSQNVTVEHGWVVSDPYSSVTAGTYGTYQLSFNMSNGGQVSIPVPSIAADGYYHVTKVPTSQTAKTIWYNTGLNQGTIPDSIYRSVYVSGSYRYYITRVPISLDTANNLKLY